MDVLAAGPLMVMRNIFLLFIIFPLNSIASDILNAYNTKDFARITQIYAQSPERAYDDKELILISHSLRKEGFNRQDIKLNVRLIKQKYLREHQKLVKAIKDGDSIDGSEYTEGLKIVYWNLLQDYGKIIEGYSNVSQLIDKDHKAFLQYNKILSNLEFRESQVDKLSDKLMAHIQDLQERVYKFSWSLSATYVSWQQFAKLTYATGKSHLTITNQGNCLGGDAGYENRYYHFYFDGCFLYGAGNVQGETSGPTYQQSSIAAYGLKAGPGVSMIVSSSRSRIGVKLPLIANYQKLSQPADTTATVKEESPLSAMLSLYSRWQFNKWYFQTEFGKYVNNDASFWGLGAGRSF